MKNLYLAGFMGTGKSTVGRLVARRLSMTFVDMDRELERRFGRPVGEIFATDGEAAFRKAERDVARDLASREGTVVAAGGGAILDDATFRAFLHSGEIICLTATPETLLDRVKRGRRPLLDTGPREERIRELLHARDGAYRRIPLHVATDGESPEALAARIASLLTPWPHRIPVSSGETAYTVEVTPGLSRALAPRLAPWARERVVVITDQNVERLHGPRVTGALRSLGVRHEVIAIRPGEASKTFTGAAALHRALLAAGADRRTLVIAFGGGVVGDLAGFVAATHKRGLPFAQVPTTLVAQLDSAIGGKNGVNLPEAKNQVGTTTAPLGVLADPRLLGTLPPRELRGGLAEAVKTAVLGSAELFEFMEAHADTIARASRRDLERGPGAATGSRNRATGREDVDDALARIVELAAGVKAAIVTRDPLEAGERRALNLGHTVGHALEAASGYRRISHGEAVSIGMVAEGRIAVNLELASAETIARIEALLARLGLPVAMPRVDRGALIAAMAHDKKADGASIHVALPRRIGRVEMIPLAPADIVRRMHT